MLKNASPLIASVIAAAIVQMRLVVAEKPGVPAHQTSMRPEQSEGHLSEGSSGDD
jgi:hypothetical protein